MLPLVLHVMGCGLFIVANIAGEGYDFRQANDIGQDSDFLQWVYGIYWAAMTVSTIGYGDVELVTFAERGYAIACMLVGASLYAYHIGALINITRSIVSMPSQQRLTLYFGSIVSIRTLTTAFACSTPLQTCLKPIMR
ncbi:hypothetical protein JKP88DRAFT_198666 [Tribonema minus]|uniref:Potassium channel domain-containing protein n=1 Tax=Tribonema minus TaxID=303371 RepID=A0A835Z1Q1_9STRA|nr:hypothetical protein JKP88DRAFT_198666 [Tribonema minus]